MSASSVESTAPRWIPPGEAVSVAGVQIDGGCLYAGPAVSAAYAQWLAAGRSERSASPAHTERFLKDLETRVLHLANRGAGAPVVTPSPTALELRELIRVLEALAASYPHHQRCSERAYSLVNLIRLGLLGERISGVPLGLDRGQPNRLAARFGLGQRVAHGEALDVDWALCWVILESVARPEDSDLAELIGHGWSIFRQAFIQAFEARHPDGILVARPDRCLALTYPAIERSIGPVQVRFPAVPGVAGHRDLRRHLEPILAGLKQQLRPLFPALKKATDAKARLRVLAGLSRPPFEVMALPEVAEFVDGVSALLSDGTHTGPLSELLECWYDETPSQLENVALRGLAAMLDWTGVALEPDPRLTGPRLEAASQISLRRSADAPRHTHEYKTARTHLFVWSAIAWADGAIHAGEIEVLNRHIDAVFPGLPAEARDRLDHLRDHLTQCAVSITRWPDIIDPLAPAQKNTLGEFVIRVVVSDGDISEAERHEARALFERLGLEPAEVDRHLETVDRDPDRVSMAPQRVPFDE